MTNTGTPMSTGNSVVNDVAETSSSATTATTNSFLSSVLEQEHMTSQFFFNEIWQQKPHLFRANNNDDNGATTATPERHNIMMVNGGWNALLDLLEQTSFKDESYFLAEPPLILKESLQVNRIDQKDKYNKDLFAMYLDGCSHIQNHADLLSPEIALLCQRIQQDFPNVYANTYLTPPNSQTFLPHADDRDVFVIQLYGQKRWSVYERVPIEYPYGHEQVGKDGLEVPSFVLDGPKSIDSTLRVGDILYIPRGHVHEARCSSDDMSFHVTIAIPTFDWTVAGMMAQATHSILTSSPELRKSLLPLASIGLTPQEQRDYAQKQINAAIQRLQEQVTVDALFNNLQARVERHQQRSTPIRQAQIEQIPLRKPTINLDTKIRWVSTTTTFASSNNRPSPLFIREDVKNVLMSIERKLEEIESTNSVYQISQLCSLIDDEDPNKSMVCDLTLISWVVQCIRSGQMEVVVV